MDSKQDPPPSYSQQPPQGYPPQPQGYPPQPQGHPPQPQGYPPQPQGYPPQPQGYPPQPQGYPPQPQGYPPQPQGYPPQQHVPGYQPVPQMQQPQVQVVTVSTGPKIFRETPITTACQHCNQVVVTRIEYENGLLVWLLIGAICFFGIPFFLFLGCCLIPLCIPSLKDVGHYCPVCNRKLGTYQRVR